MKIQLASAVLAVTVGVAHAQSPEVTPIRLKALQSRKFEKNPNQVLRAVETHCKDNGASNVILQQALVDATTYKHILGTGKVTCFWSAPKISMSLFSGITVERSVAKIEAEAIDASREYISLRSRVHMHSEIGKTEQLTDEETYSKLYKAIGDAVFAEAIPITAQVQE